MNLPNIQEVEVYKEKINELKLIIKLTKTYYNKFGGGLFPE